MCPGKKHKQAERVRHASRRWTHRGVGRGMRGRKEPRKEKRIPKVSVKKENEKYCTPGNKGLDKKEEKIFPLKMMHIACHEDEAGKCEKKVERERKKENRPFF